MGVLQSHHGTTSVHLNVLRTRTVQQPRAGHEWLCKSVFTLMWNPNHSVCQAQVRDNNLIPKDQVNFNEA